MRKLAKYAILLCVGIVLSFVSHEIYRAIKPVSVEYDNWLGYSSTENYRSLKITGSPGKVHEEIIEDGESGNPSIYRLSFNAYNSPYKIKVIYPVDTLSGEALIQVDGPGGMKYSDTEQGRMVALSNESDNSNGQYVTRYYDYDSNGTLDCIHKKSKRDESEVWITVGKKLVSVKKVPENIENGMMETSDGNVTYRFVEGYWQAL